jgi:hypothetical protein
MSLLNIGVRTPPGRRCAAAGSTTATDTAAAEVGFVEATLDPALAGMELLVYRGVHSKTLGAGVNGETVYSSYTPENTRVFEFLSDSCLPALEGFAYSRTSQSARE